MERRPITAFMLVAGAVSFLPGWLPGFPQQERPDFVIRSDVRLVILDVDVKDRHGSTVSGLTKDNFKVLEDGKPQSITVFAHEDLPVTVGILVDESFSMRSKRADVLAAAETFIQESNPRDEVFVLNFNDTVRFGLPPGMLFSGDRKQLGQALARAIPEGKTALNDAVVAGIKQLEKGKRSKKALVLISDGGDNASRHTRGEMLDLVEASAATIYTIGVYDPDDPDRDPRILHHLARISGGDAYFPNNPEGTVPICQRIARDIRTRYTIGYIPQADSGNASLRHIHVQVSAPGHSHLRTQTRTSYRYVQLKNQTDQ
jgi:Ca-activated chloride channel family protein